MTQQEMDKERAEKERTGVTFVDVAPPGKTKVRVFADGTAYTIGGYGGRYVKFVDKSEWDFDAPEASMQYVHDEDRWKSENDMYTTAWQTLQDLD